MEWKIWSIPLGSIPHYSVLVQQSKHSLKWQWFSVFEKNLNCNVWIIRLSSPTIVPSILHSLVILSLLICLFVLCLNLLGSFCVLMVCEFGHQFWVLTPYSGVIWSAILIFLLIVCHLITSNVLWVKVLSIIFVLTELLFMSQGLWRFQELTLFNDSWFLEPWMQCWEGKGTHALSLLFSYVLFYSV